MTGSARTRVEVGEKVLTANGTALVMAIEKSSVKLRDCVHNIVQVRFDQLGTVRGHEDGEWVALVEPLRPLWDALSDAARNVALMRLEVVQEVITGYRDGHPELKRKGEPFKPFGPTWNASEHRKAVAMAAELGMEGHYNREAQRRLHDGAIQSTGVSPSTIKNWLRRWRKDGLLGLIDGRHLRPTTPPQEAVPPLYRSAAEKIITSFDGDRSTVSNLELDRQIRLVLKDDGIEDIQTPERKTNEYLSFLRRQIGSTTRSQRSHSLRGVSGHKHYPAIRPGQIVAVDVTRADNLVFDPLSGQPYSVEIITAIDVATRVVLALRVVPRSASGFEAGLLVYDICRPFSLTVSGTSLDDWRWVGIPEQLDLSHAPVRVGRRRLAPDFSTLQGEHPIPSVKPDALHYDHGGIFVSNIHHDLLSRFQIDLTLTRGGKPSDNPHIERWFETLQRCVQQIPGYKGRNTSQRGRLVAKEPLLTAPQLQDRIRRFVALDYHRDWHTGLVLSADPDTYYARLCPLEIWDAMVEVTGYIDVPQQPDLLYQFLPVRWGTVRQDGVEFSNMTYDSPLLDPYRQPPKGTFRDSDAAAPFSMDPNDLSRIWFPDPSTGRVEEIPWRGKDRCDAPCTRNIVDAACRIIRARGGNNVLTRHSATRLILAELGELTRNPPRSAWKTLAAATQRVEQSRADHEEAQQAQNRVVTVHAINPRESLSDRFRQPWPNLLEEN
ncbi:leucine zipper domain-containing protein [Mycolicibacterium sp. CBMA 226]|uniref:leucine zipper domain-containing protein n=1 Tax=Mycolicibacterium sp. CBMA 226 TaxID=2606611 RepID=UPI0012DCD1D4|nr:leucine zipper domain-containing protein [Mycolicibacterium sp. CBMA 226]MUL74488.1 transposase [Mycolicibacterium sp. CBMA 226]